uniref:Uncharacterized protein n=1 Tax=Micrurus surinamensis TaxID=129470 RepID=A0A2D4PXF1_MICSU
MVFSHSASDCLYEAGSIARQIAPTAELNQKQCQFKRLNAYNVQTSYVSGHSCYHCLKTTIFYLKIWIKFRCIYNLYIKHIRNYSVCMQNYTLLRNTDGKSDEN